MELEWKLFSEEEPKKDLAFLYSREDGCVLAVCRKDHKGVMKVEQSENSVMSASQAGDSWAYIPYSPATLKRNQGLADQQRKYNVPAWQQRFWDAHAACKTTERSAEYEEASKIYDAMNQKAANESA